MRGPDSFTASRLTVAQWADRRLRTAILSGELKPGARILPSKLAEAWDVSATPLREAIHRLAGDGLIEESPHRGARVKTPSRSDLLDLYDLRLMLEPHALAMSLRASDDTHRARMRQTADHLAAAMADPAADMLTVEEFHRDYHRSLFERCSSDRLIGFIETLSQHSSYYRLLVQRVPSRGGEEAANREHAQLLDMCVAGEVEGAVEVLRHHLETTARALLGSPLMDGGAMTEPDQAVSDTVA